MREQKEQIHKRLTAEKVKSVFEMYLNGAIGGNKARELLDIKKTQFFDWLKKFKNDPSFSIDYERKTPTNRIDSLKEETVIKELELERSYIANKDVSIKFYNYSYIKNLISEKYDIYVSIPTIIKIAKKKAIIFLNRIRKITTARLTQTISENSSSTTPRTTYLRLMLKESGI